MTMYNIIIMYFNLIFILNIILIYYSIELISYIYICVCVYVVEIKENKSVRMDS